MVTNLRIFLVSLFLTCGLLACTDHRLRPLSPLNFRLKTVGGTTITYDQGNCVTSYNGNAKLFFYDDQS